MKLQLNPLTMLALCQHLSSLGTLGGGGLPDVLVPRDVDGEPRGDTCTCGASFSLHVGETEVYYLSSVRRVRVDVASCSSCDVVHSVDGAEYGMLRCVLLWQQSAAAGSLIAHKSARALMLVGI